MKGGREGVARAAQVKYKYTLSDDSSTNTILSLVDAPTKIGLLIIAGSNFPNILINSIFRCKVLLYERFLNNAHFP